MKLLTIVPALTLAALPLSAFAGANSDDGTCSSSITATIYSGEKNIVETAVAAGQFKTLAAALGAADLVGALQGDGPFTVFAPTDEAFAKLPKGTVEMLLKPENKSTLATILTYHVVPGRVAAADVVKLDSASALNGQRISISADDTGVRVAGSTVVKADIACSNGIIHVVDTVMMPATKNVVETAVAAGTFKTLAAALKAGELVEALSGKGPFTVFAPTDAAFAKLPEGTVEMLLKPENKDKLVAVLTYHVVPSRVYSDQLANGSVKTLQGSPLSIALKKEGAFIGGAKVTTADIETTNGVVHVIDTVLLPK